MSEKIEFVYSTDELDGIIRQIEQGITPMMSDQMALEVKLRYQQLQAELFDEEVDIDEGDLAKQKEAMRRHMEKKKREATKNDVTIIKLTDAQRKQLYEEMEVSIVRTNPNSPYNIPDDELYSSEELRIIQQKLSRIKNCYYNQHDYVNAINIIREAIEYSLTHDYPWLSREEAIQQFNAGKIKFTYCNLPKLFINYSTQITDPEILKGVVTGEVTLKDKSERPVKKPQEYKPIPYEYGIIGESEFNRMAQLHMQGYDTPVSPIIKAKSTIYNRFSLPTNNRFSGSGNGKNNEPILFDWTREGAGQAYYDMINGKKTTTSDIIRMVNEANDGLLNNVVNTNANEFLRSMKTIHTEGGGQYQTNSNMISTSLQVNPEAARIEQNILEAIKANNPNL